MQEIAANKLQRQTAAALVLLDHLLLMALVGSDLLGMDQGPQRHCLGCAFPDLVGSRLGGCHCRDGLFGWG